MNKHSISIDLDLHKLLEKNRESFGESQNAILRRMLGLEPAATIDSTPGGANLEGLFTKGILIPEGTKLRGTQRGKSHDAVVKDGIVDYNGQGFPSLSAAACHATGNNRNGWTFWNYWDEATSSWISIHNLRKQAN